jgi:hypothetical protein
MITDRIDVRYFKLAVGSNLKKESDSDISANCIACNDKKGRLHLFQKDGMPVPLVRCFNGGCILEETTNMQKFLGLTRPNLLQIYKKEKMKDAVKKLQEGDALNEILNIVNEKTGVNRDENVNHDKLMPDLPKFFKDILQPVKDFDNHVAKDYIHSRCLELDENLEDMYYCEKQFVLVNDKKYYVKNSIWLPLYWDNKLQGFYTRCVDEKKFSTIILKNSIKIWTSKNLDLDNDVFIFEGIFDAVASGTNSVALLGLDLPMEIEDDIPKKVWCYDNDETGIQKAIQKVENGERVFIFPEKYNDYKDVNELKCETNLSTKEIREMIEENIFSGVRAITSLKMKAMRTTNGLHLSKPKGKRRYN